MPKRCSFKLYHFPTPVFHLYEVYAFSTNSYVECSYFTANLVVSSVGEGATTTATKWFRALLNMVNQLVKECQPNDGPRLLVLMVPVVVVVVVVVVLLVVVVLSAESLIMVELVGEDPFLPSLLR